MPIINEVVSNFGRGMYHASPITDMIEGGSTLLRNVAIIQGRYIGNRKGFKKYTTELIMHDNIVMQITGIHQYDNGTTKELIVTAGTKVYIWNSDTLSYTEQSGITITAGYKQHFVDYYDSVVMYNGVDRPLAYNGKTWSVVTNAPIGVFMEPYRGNLFAADKDNRDRILFSNYVSLNTWDSTDFDTVSENRFNDPMMALRKVSDTVGALAASKNGIWTLQGGSEESFAFYPLATGVGCISHETMKCQNKMAIWLDEDGFYRLADISEDSSSGKIAAVRFRELDGIMGMVDYGRITSAWAEMRKGSENELRQYMCGLTIGSGKSSNNYLFVYDMGSGGWRYDIGLPCDIITTARDDNDMEIVLATNNKDGYVYQLYDDTSDNGSAISACYISPPVCGRQMLGDAAPRVKKRLASIEIWYRSKYENNVKLLITADTTGGTFPSNGTPQSRTFLAEGSAPYQYEYDTIESSSHFLLDKYARRMEIPVGLDGYYFQLKIDNNSGIQDWVIYQIVFNMQVSGEIYGIVKAANIVVSG